MREKLLVIISSWFAPGGTPLHKIDWYVLIHRVGFLCRFGLKTGLKFAHFGLELGTTEVYKRIYHFNSS